MCRYHRNATDIGFMVPSLYRLCTKSRVSACIGIASANRRHFDRYIYLMKDLFSITLPSHLSCISVMWLVTSILAMVRVVDELVKKIHSRIFGESKILLMMSEKTQNPRSIR